MIKMDIKGSKIAELTYLTNQLAAANTNEVLIVGEREGSEGVSSYTLNSMAYSDILTMTDITPVEPGSYVEEAIKNTNVSFIQDDFIKFDAGVKYDVIVCISVLEHFGMKFDGMDMFKDDIIPGSDIIRWNHDLLGIKRMTELIKDSGKIIVTVPAGRYMNYDENGYPFLRYYTAERRLLIEKYLHSFGYKLTNEEWAISYNLSDWFKTEKIIMDHENYEGARWRMNSYTPNGLWNFCIERE